MKGVRNGVSIFLSTGYCVGPIIAILLNLILPEEIASEEAENLESDSGTGTEEVESKKGDSEA
jgi:xanthine/uracil permease